MLIKAGVYIDRLNPDIRRTLGKLENIFIQFSEELVITSTYEGNHSASSLHYRNDAIDLRRPKNADVGAIYEKIKEVLGEEDFDFHLGSTHIHIEYDPRR